MAKPTEPPTAFQEIACPLSIDPLLLQIADRLEKKFGLSQVEPIHAMTHVGENPEYLRSHYRAWLNGRKIFIKHYGNACGKSVSRDEFRFGDLLHRINANNFPEAFFYSNDEHYRCIAFEFLEGETLGFKINRGSLASLEKGSIIRQLKDIARSLLESGIVHRDLHPENLFVTKDGALKLIDFGAAVDGQRHEKRYAAGKNPVWLIPIWTKKLVGRRYVDDMVRILDILEKIGCHESYQETYHDCEAYLKEYLKDKPVQHIRRQWQRTGVSRVLRKLEHRAKLVLRPFLYYLKQNSSQGFQLIWRWLRW